VQTTPCSWKRFTAAIAFFCLALCLPFFLIGSALSDNPTSDTVGTIDGDAIGVTGPMTAQMVGGQVVTVLRSGSDVRVKSGSARINLVEGGQISVCGPAHLSVLKSGGALTIALDTGSIHTHVEREPALTIYTPQIQAQPVAIGGGAQDTVVGFDAAGAMCIRAQTGAVRIEQQLTGQSVLVPQGGDILLIDGQLDTLSNGDGSSGQCSCELRIANAAPPPPEVSQIASAEEVRKKTEEAKPAPPSAPAIKPVIKEEPVYKVYVPPLMFDANAKVQPEVDPRMIVLMRRVRVRPTLIFEGKVEGNGIAGGAPIAHVPPTATPAKPVPATTESVVGRVRNFVRKLWRPSS